ncbi:peptidase T [Lignipirellula cremea]|uniref:Peptidase T n=1 Tax=Lignipirellula cremea TaxID=2528010 RepID=A0A518DM83_9BACT|nr:peptidase T [Lignipirellula cremea]QDU92945.1 Peptidase T [Lignipirellula cremea]
MNTERLLQRFLRYVQIDTTAVSDADCYPSSLGQLELGRLLREELQAMGAESPVQDEHGIVTATIPGNTTAPAIALNAHLDTSPETTGAGVKPQVIRNYAGGDLVLPGDPTKVIRESENPELAKLHGATLITTDGRTLLGGDDKAGVAVIMETAEWLLEHPEIPHGPVRVLFTCDEEIGHGVDHVDVPGLNATVGYTLDGAGAGEIDVETFSADQAVVVVRGVNIHPSIAKGQMVNAIRAAADFVAALPADLAPETTADRQGFLHPWRISGGVAETTLHILLRDFDSPRLEEFARLLQETAAQVQQQHPGSEITVRVDRQYRNLGDGLKREPRAVACVEQAYQRLGRPYRQTLVRGGTDGSLLTEKGLPTPNLSTGQHKIHSPLEWACLDEMQQAGELLIELCQVWAEAD